MLINLVFTCFFRIALSVCECLKEIKHRLGKIGKRFLRGYKVTFKLCQWIDAEDPIEPWSGKNLFAGRNQELITV
ncbi:hypothetical protein IH879_22140 [candidate division KSB1 bacterium]|nr:hypothetical protein [candidate division KSB1 bacterium]